MRVALLLYAALCLAVVPTASSERALSASPSCGSLTTCTACASAKSWTGGKCRWCPLAKDLSCHAEGSLSNKCSGLQDITTPDRCDGAAHPAKPEQVRLAFVCCVGACWCCGVKTDTSHCRGGGRSGGLRGSHRPPLPPPNRSTPTLSDHCPLCGSAPHAA